LTEEDTPSLAGSVSAFTFFPTGHTQGLRRTAIKAKVEPHPEETQFKGLRIKNVTITRARNREARHKGLISTLLFIRSPPPLLSQSNSDAKP
jgi:hypothetical protein